MNINHRAQADTMPQLSISWGQENKYRQLIALGTHFDKKKKFL